MRSSFLFPSSLSWLLAWLIGNLSWVLKNKDSSSHGHSLWNLQVDQIQGSRPPHASVLSSIFPVDQFLTPALQWVCLTPPPPPVPSSLLIVAVQGLKQNSFLPESLFIGCAWEEKIRFLPRPHEVDFWDLITRFSRYLPTIWGLVGRYQERVNLPAVQRLWKVFP